MDKLHFNLVSPERELFSGDVDQVTVPGTEGDFGVLPKHAPVMSAIRPGAITIKDGGDTRRVFIRGGFADVTPDGLTILAEEAVDCADLDPAQVDQDIQNAREDLADAKNDEQRQTAQEALERLEAMKAALAG